MPYGFVQQIDNDSVSSSLGTLGSGAFGANTVAGRTLTIVVWYQAASAVTVTITGNGMAAGAFTAETVLSAGGTHIQGFYAENIAGGSAAEISASFSANVAFPAIWVAEWSGFKTASSRLAHVRNNQNTPGTGTDAVTSTLLGTLSEQPAGIIGFTFNENTDSTPAAGTGFTGLTGVNDYGGGTPGARGEHKRVTATTSVAALFTAGTNQVHKTVAWAFSEAASGSYTLVAAQGSYSLTGQAANLLVNKLLVADQGSYALTGQAANLSYSAAGRTLIADTGFYTLIGSDALVDLGMNAEFGTYNLTGQDAILTYAPLNSYTLVAASGTYNLNGQDANLLMGRVLPCVSGQYNLTGFASGLTWSGAAASGAYHGKIHMGLSDFRL